MNIYAYKMYLFFYNLLELLLSEDTYFIFFFFPPGSLMLHKTHIIIDLSFLGNCLAMVELYRIIIFGDSPKV